MNLAELRNRFRPVKSSPTKHITKDFHRTHVTFFSDSPELRKYHSFPSKSKINKNYYETKSWMVFMLSVWRKVKFHAILDVFLHFEFVFVDLPVTHCLLCSQKNCSFVKCAKISLLRFFFLKDPFYKDMSKIRIFNTLTCNNNMLFMLSHNY